MGIKYTHQCKGTENNHDKNHLCQIVAARDMGRVKKLVKDSIFYCKNCGRTAHIEKNLCNPAKI